MWTSTLRRTVQTASYLGREIVQWKGLDEIDAGVWVVCLGVCVLLAGCYVGCRLSLAPLTFRLMQVYVTA